MKDKVTVISSCESRHGNIHSKNYEPMSKRLVHSIRTNGGKYKDVNIVMWHSEEAAPSVETKVELEAAGCVLVSGETLIAGEPVGNKIIACCTSVDTEFSLWMDSDMYVLQPDLFEQLVERDVDVAAVGCERSDHRWGRLEDAALWEQFYILAGVTPPTGRFTAGLDGGPVHFYFNSAIVFFRNNRGFPETWRDLALKVRHSGIENAEHNFTQTSLTLAVLKILSAYEPLPQTYNAYYSLEREASLDRAMLHYQSDIITDPRVKWGA